MVAAESSTREQVFTAKTWVLWQLDIWVQSHFLKWNEEENQQKGGLSTTVKQQIMKETTERKKVHNNVLGLVN